jgi:hypothetical protein
MARMNGPRERIDHQRTNIFDPDAPGGPGWFDSSWELDRGLEVREGLPSDASLHEWLETWLRM